MDEELEHAIIKLNEAFFDGETPMDFLGFDYRSIGYSGAVYFLRRIKYVLHEFPQFISGIPYLKFLSALRLYIGEVAL